MKTLKELLEIVENEMEGFYYQAKHDYASDLLQLAIDDYGEEFEVGGHCEETIFLNGAKNWNQYSRGGCSVVPTVEIIERLRHKHPTEEWVDAQARVLQQASDYILALARGEQDER